MPWRRRRRGGVTQPDVEQILICTPDKDMTQCVRDGRIVCFDRMRRKMIDEAAVVEKFGVPPASIADWLALVGDSADGYPGVPRWGAKSAAAVLAHYGHLEAIPEQRAPVERERDEARLRSPPPSRSSRRGVSLSSSRDAAHRCAARGNARRSAMAGRAHARSSRISVASLATTTSSGAYRSGAMSNRARCTRIATVSGKGSPCGSPKPVYHGAHPIIRFRPTAFTRCRDPGSGTEVAQVLLFGDAELGWC